MFNDWITHSYLASYQNAGGLGSEGRSGEGPRSLNHRVAHAVSCMHTSRNALSSNRMPLLCGGTGSPAGRRDRDGRECWGTMNAWSLLSSLVRRHTNTRGAPPWAIGGSTEVPGSSIFFLLIPFHSSGMAHKGPGPEQQLSIMSPMPRTSMAAPRLPREHGLTQTPLRPLGRSQLCSQVRFLLFPLSLALL